MSTEIIESQEAGFASKQAFELMQRGAVLLSKSTLVPKIYQGEQGISNCVIALNMAMRIGADPLMVMQNLYVVHGNPSWSAQFLISTFNTCGRFSAIRYKWTGERATDTWGCIAYATEKETGEVLEGAEVTIALAKKEGWYSKNGSKWQSMPQQMLMYRSAAWFVRAYAPELAMGLKTVDEVDDMTIEPVKPVTRTESLLGKLTSSATTEATAPKSEPTSEAKPTEATAEKPSVLDEAKRLISAAGTLAKLKTLEDRVRASVDFSTDEKCDLGDLIDIRRKELGEPETPKDGKLFDEGPGEGHYAGGH